MLQFPEYSKVTPNKLSAADYYWTISDKIICS